jgi:hypothetical protein
MGKTNSLLHSDLGSGLKWLIAQSTDNDTADKVKNMQYRAPDPGFPPPPPVSAVMYLGVKKA